jgi:hypothetical protein
MRNDQLTISRFNEIKHHIRPSTGFKSFSNNDEISTIVEKLASHASSINE